MTYILPAGLLPYLAIPVMLSTNRLPFVTLWGLACLEVSLSLVLIRQGKAQRLGEPQAHRTRVTLLIWTGSFVASYGFAILVGFVIKAIHGT